MFSALILATAIGAFPDEPAPVPPSPDLAAYQKETAKVGKTAEAHVRLALWCEAHGLTAERLKHLSLAVLNDPTNALARGLMGLIAYQGKWGRPDVIGRQIQNDPGRQAIIREYLDRRVRTPDTGEAQTKLAAWCEEKGLKEQALAHYSAVTRISPSRDSAWKRLGYKKQGNRWVKPEEVAAAKQEAAHQKQADKQWKPRLEKLRAGLESKDASKRAQAEHGLTEVTDPRAVPMIWANFASGGQRVQIAAVQMLGQIDGPSASNGLAVLAVFSPIAGGRRRATETLTRRDPRDVVGRLIGLIHKPYKYQVRHVNGPGSPGELFVEGERFNVQRFYQNLSVNPALVMGRIFTPDVPFDPYSVRNLLLATVPSFTTSGGVFAYNRPFQDPNHLFASYPLPVSPQSAALAAQAIAANPRNGAAILSQLINDPANRFAPPGYWFFPASQVNGVNPQHPVMIQPMAQNGPATPGNLDPLVPHTVPFNTTALRQFKVTQQDINNALHQAETVKKLESNPANRQDGIVLEMMDNVAIQAAQRDIQIAQEIERIRQSNQNLEQMLAMDVQYVEATNAGINLVDERSLPVLKAITGVDLGVAPEKWKHWWLDQLGYVYQSDVPTAKPTFTDFVSEPLPVGHAACFAAGTLVQTIDGPAPIESIRIGDRVLSQGTSTGQLAFQPVVATYRNQPQPTLKIAIGGESIVATGIHRFWKAGKGWTMARELKAGDRLRMVGGTVEIESIEADKIQPVYNLDVAGDRDFFVGARGFLVHDFSFVQPVFEPFDQEPVLGSLAAPVSK
jgi:tetratricopeptide (TPR) repeat protein